MESDFDRSTKAKANDTEKRWRGYPVISGYNMGCAFEAGRDSAKPSLEILARACELAHALCDPVDGKNIFEEAIAEVRSNGDWPLEEK